MRQSLIGDIILPIRIDTPFAVGPVYSYLVKDEKNVLVDCGHKSDSSYQQLKRALSEQNLGVGDIDEIWLTHGHPDHYGQAAKLADESGAHVKGHAKERGNFAANDNAELFEAFFHQHDIPEKQIALMVDQLDWLQQYQEAIEPEWISQGETLATGTLNFTIKHAPGHAPGHVVFYSDEGIIFGGDVLLGHISTNALVNFDPETGSRNKSLLQYRKTLQWMQERQGVVLPGHGERIENIGEVAAHHLSEQRKRYEAILSLISDHPRTLIELSQILFADAMDSGAHFLVFSEIIGYLDWAVAEGAIEAEEDTPVVYHPAN